MSAFRNCVTSKDFVCKQLKKSVIAMILVLKSNICIARKHWLLTMPWKKTVNLKLLNKHVSYSVS